MDSHIKKIQELLEKKDALSKQEKYAISKAVEAQHRELEIETALETVRSVAMGMQEPADMLHICKAISAQLQSLGVKEIRNVQTAIMYQHKGTYLNYEFYAKHNKVLTTEVEFNNHPMSKAFVRKMLGGPGGFFKKSLKGKKVQDWYRFQKTTNQFADKYLAKAVSLNYYWYSLGPVALGISTYKLLSKEEENVCLRFRNVFQLAYKRFLDIENANAQAREAQIEAALEKVRSRTMAMQHSDELKNAAALLFQQVKALGVPAYSCGYNIWESNEKVFTSWMSTQDGSDFNAVLNIPLTEDANFICFADSREKGEPFFVLELRGARMQKHYRYLNTIPEFKTWFDYAATAGFDMPETQIHHIANFSHGNLLFITLEPCPEFHDVFRRFASIFDQTYTRFLDLQKAEAQAREAKIEAALERTRTQSMIMQHSKELDDTLRVFHEQVLVLGIHSAFSFLWLPDEDKDRHIFWAAWAESDPIVFKSKAINYPLDRNEPATKQCLVDWKSNQSVVSYHVPPAGVKSYFAAWQELIAGVEELNPKNFSNGLFYVEAFMKYGCFGIMVKNELSEDEKKILHRFTIEFERTYTRFLDLQKAEAQAREAQIEASLERVRAKAMAMHSSEDLSVTVNVFFRELKTLSIIPIRVGVAELNKETHTSNLTATNALHQGESYEILGRLILKGHPVLENIFHHWVRQEEYYPVLKGKDVTAYYRAMKPYVSFPDYQDDIVQYGSYFSFMEGVVFAWTDKPLSEEEVRIFRRFSTVISLTFRRYKDLREAEAQAREAQIELALERVRAKAMAMQQSNDLASAVAIIFEELDKLDLGMLRCGIGILHKETRTGDVWTTSLSDQGKTLQVSGDESMDIHPLLKGAFEGWLKQEDFSYVLEGKDLNNYYRALTKVNFHLPEAKSLAEQKGLRQYYHCATWQSGGLFAFRETEFPEEAKIVMKRFADVFTLTYTRFLDLQKAEANAREAKIETGLERVRSRTLAMQSSGELAETAAVVVQQLVNLGIPPNRLYIAIIHDETRSIEFWITDEDGNKVSQQFTADVSRNDTLKKMYDGWKAQKKSIIIDMQGKEVENYLHYLNNELHVSFKGGLSQQRRVQSIAYFGKGFMGIGSPEQQSEGTIGLLERFASAFNLTYTRFNDLKIAEAHAIQAERDLIELKAAKQRAEDTLTELKATQEQLIQQEKLASLGQLTAGIAHEIKNPLNFVNNFSDVSIELVAEAREELKKINGDVEKEDILAILDDVDQNLKKIHEHGSRADGIVKSMLHHSRSSNGKMEPTDLNAMIKEYVNLAFHGMRAGKNPITVDIQMNLDESVGILPLISEDFSRVILNLSQNAFDAMREKLGTVKFSPVLALRTKRLGDKVQIEIEDNGPGIPDEIKDKILQPFFTTKKGTQGTGLGLSITNDIVKAHRGELKIDSRGDGGALFTIVLLKSGE